MVNPVYLLPKSGLPTQPNVMQIRTLTAAGPVSQTNGLVTNASILPRKLLRLFLLLINNYRITIGLLFFLRTIGKWK